MIKLEIKTTNKKAEATKEIAMDNKFKAIRVFIKT